LVRDLNFKAAVTGMYDKDAYCPVAPLLPCGAIRGTRGQVYGVSYSNALPPVQANWFTGTTVRTIVTVTRMTATRE